MLIVHRADCSGCVKLLPRLVNSAEMRELSENFIVVQSDGEVGDDYAEAQGEDYFPRFENS